VKELYEIGKWREFKKYSCKLCPYETLNEEDMINHIEQFHMPRPERRKVKVPIFDRYGNLIKEQEV